MWSTAAPPQHTVADPRRLQASQNAGLRITRKHRQLNRSRSRCRVGSDQADISTRCGLRWCFAPQHFVLWRRFVERKTALLPCQYQCNAVCSYRRAAQHAVDNFVKDGQLVGLGHGSMVCSFAPESSKPQAVAVLGIQNSACQTQVIYALEHLAKRIQQGVLKVSLIDKCTRLCLARAFAIAVWLHEQDVSCLAASDVASVEAAVHGIPLRPMQDTMQVLLWAPHCKPARASVKYQRQLANGALGQCRLTLPW